MKDIVRALIMVALIFTATESFARGFSIGLFGTYSIDKGQIEDTINDRRFFEGADAAPAPGSVPTISYDEIIIPGAGLFASYTFRNGFSIRTGAEYYTLVAGGDILKVFNTIYNIHSKYEIEYNSYAVPLLLGITLSPDKGKTNIYAYGGMVLSMINISQYFAFINPSYSFECKYESANEAIVPGFAALIGTERRLFSGFYVMLEFAFYKCEKNREEWGELYNSTNPSLTEYSYTERYGLPRQQVRIGIRYSF